MGIRLVRFPQYGVTLHVYSGALRAHETAKHFRRLCPGDISPAVHAFGADVDLSGFDVEHIPFVKHAIALKEANLPGGRPKRSVVIARSEAVHEFFCFWNSYCDFGHLNVTPFHIASSMKEACDWLRLPEGACEALTAAEAGPETLHSTAAPA